MWERFSEAECGAILWHDWIEALCGVEFASDDAYLNLLDRVKDSGLDADVRDKLTSLITLLYFKATEN